VASRAVRKMIRDLAALDARLLRHVEALHVGQHDFEDHQVRLERVDGLSAEAPSPAVSTANRWKRSAMEITSAMVGSSSTTRMRCVVSGSGSMVTDRASAVRLGIASEHGGATRSAGRRRSGVTSMTPGL
jgi:hypothetical protein